MVRIKFSTRSIDRMADNAEREFDRLHSDILEIADWGAAQLREHDSYTDRTGDLRKSTDAFSSGHAAKSVNLEMGMHYASYVHNLGYSDFDEVAELVERQIDRGIDAMLRRI